MPLVICLRCVLTTITYIKRNIHYCFNKQFYLNELSFRISFLDLHYNFKQVFQFKKKMKL